MSDLMIRRNREMPAARYREVGRAEKTTGGSQTQKAAGTTGFAVSETLRQLMTKGSQMEFQIRESRQTLQLGEAVLDVVQEKLGRIAELVQESAGDGNPDRDELQSELEQLLGEIDRIISSAAVDGVQLFLGEDAENSVEALLRTITNTAGQEKILPNWLVKGMNAMDARQLLTALGLDETASGPELLAAVMNRPLDSDPAASRLAVLYLGAVIAGSDLSQAIDTDEALEGLRQLLEQVADGVPLDEAVASLTDGMFSGILDFENQFTSGIAPDLQSFLTNLLLLDAGSLLPDGTALMPLLAGFGGWDLLMELLASQQSSLSALEPSPAPDPAAEMEIIEASTNKTDGIDEINGRNGPDAASVLQIGNVQVTGRDLSGVSLDASTGVLTVGGQADVVIQGTGQGEQAVLVAGTGTVTLQNVNLSTFTVSAAGASIFSAERNSLGEVQLQKGASLTLGGSGVLDIGTFHANRTNTLRITGGAVVINGGNDEDSENSETILTVPVSLEGPASLAAQAASVRNANGKPLDAFDIIWKVLLPGWSCIDALAADGKQARMALLNGSQSDPARLWLEKGDPSHGYPIHTVLIRGKDQAGHVKTRYAYLRWNQNSEAFEEISMYPNPFTVTGGEQNKDWIYEEPSHTLHILSNQVAAISGGSGTNAEQAPFNGRIALADHIGEMELTLDGVRCRVSAGRAFSLGRENNISLVLQSGTENYFESGAACAGISLGDRTSLRIDRTRNCGGASVGALTATGGAGGAGIGRDSGGSRDQTSHILIDGGAITATGTGGGAGIGGALGAPVGDISIHGGTITAVAAYHAAAIGAGIRGECGDILITKNARILKARGGDPGADIGACLFGGCGNVFIAEGANIGGARTRSGISLQTGESTLMLPQFRLSSRALRLNGLRVSTQESAQAARMIIDADRRWVSQIQAAYKALYGQVEHHNGDSVQQGGMPDKMVRDTKIASSLLQDMRQAILLQSSQTMRTHSRRGSGDVRHLLQ